MANLPYRPDFHESLIRFLIDLDRDVQIRVRAKSRDRQRRRVRVVRAARPRVIPRGPLQGVRSAIARPMRLCQIIPSTSRMAATGPSPQTTATRPTRSGNRAAQASVKGTPPETPSRLKRGQSINRRPGNGSDSPQPGRSKPIRRISDFCACFAARSIPKREPGKPFANKWIV